MGVKILGEEILNTKYTTLARMPVQVRDKELKIVNSPPFVYFPGAARHCSPRHMRRTAYVAVQVSGASGRVGV